MIFIVYVFIVVSRLIYSKCSVEISYNLPNLSSCAGWNPNGTTFMGHPLGIYKPYAIFIDKYDDVYLTTSAVSYVYVWHNGSSSPTAITLDTFFKLKGLFVLTTGDIYVSHRDGEVRKSIGRTNTFEIVGQFCHECYAIFVAINNVIYCSMESYQLIATKSLDSHSDIITVVAGTGIGGREAHLLHLPKGIFVNTNLDLYVADSSNNRIQMFRSGDINGITIAESSNKFQLYTPSGVVLDANGHLYILDSWNNRIVTKTVDDFRCLVGCTTSGSSSEELHSPISMAFDSFGNMYVTDPNNNRVQKFLLSNNTCNSTNTKTMSITSISTTGSSTLMTSVYTSALTKNSPTYRIHCLFPVIFCYETVQMHVVKDSDYHIIVSTSLPISISVHTNYFDTTNVHLNMVFRLFAYCDDNKVKFTIKLRSNETYVLKVETIHPQNETSSFSIVAMGPSEINFNKTGTSASKAPQAVYSSELTTNSYKCYDRCSSSVYYDCLAVKIYVTEEGYYTVTSNSTIYLYAYLYRESRYFNLFDLSKSLVGTDHNGNCDGQFKITTPKVKTSFIIAVTTHSTFEHGAFFIIVTGPSNASIKYIDIPPVIETNYSLELNSHSSKHGFRNCYLLEYYYEVYEIHVNTSGNYMFSSESNFHTIAFLYSHGFDPYNPDRFRSTTSDTTSCKTKQFKVTNYLNSNTTYILMVTTPLNYKNMIGTFSLIVRGPSRISINRIVNVPSIIQSQYSSKLTENSLQYSRETCHLANYYYESIQINVNQSNFYTFMGMSNISTFGDLYAHHFNPYNPSARLLAYKRMSCSRNNLEIIDNLQSNITYILVVATSKELSTGAFSILASGPANVSFYRLTLQTTYTSELTKETQVYPRICGQGNYHYETIEIKVEQSGSYTFDGNSSILLYGYIYEHEFDPSYVNENLLTQSNFTCGKHFHVGTYLEINIKYILLVTTFDPNMRGSFILHVTGPNNITLNRIIKKQSSCVIGDQCNLFTKTIGLTINDILRNQIQSNIPLIKQSALIQVAASITMIMFLIGLINGIFSLITFKNKELRNVGCGIYLFASSITSLLTVTMFTTKFWFVVLIQLYSIVHSSILRADCIFIGPFLKLCLYLDGWFNACVAIERTVNVSKGVTFDKKMSRRMARYIVVILPIIIMGSIIHEPIHHEMFEYPIQKYELIENNSTINETSEYQPITEYRILCVIRYSRSLQNYNTVMLFLHLIVPFVVNLCSAIFIIFGTARQRSTTQRNQTFKEHALKQMNEHKQLLISPLILLLLAIPRLILSLVSGCVDPSTNPWLYLCGYFISYIPPMLVFAVFVLPSELYTKTFKESIMRWRQQKRQ